MGEKLTKVSLKAIIHLLVLAIVLLPCKRLEQETYSCQACLPTLSKAFVRFTICFPTKPSSRLLLDCLRFGDITVQCGQSRPAALRRLLERKSTEGQCTGPNREFPACQLGQPPPLYINNHSAQHPSPQSGNSELLSNRNSGPDWGR